MTCNCCVPSITKNNDEKIIHTTDTYVNGIVETQKIIYMIAITRDGGEGGGVRRTTFEAKI